MQDFLPVTKKEMKQRGWNQVDFAYITGDAYVDHPSFGTAIISRLLEAVDIKWESSVSRTGRRKRVSRYLVSRDWDFWYQRETWIPW